MPLTMRPTGLSRLCGAGNGQGSGHDRDHEQLAVRPHLAASSPDPNIGLRLTNIKPDMTTA